MYAGITEFLSKFFKKSTIFRYGMSNSPMYRRTVGKILYVSDDLYEIRIKIPLNYKNSNYVGTIFGGSLFSATDPFYMTQILSILGDEYVVWDKESTIKFKRPAKETVFARFQITKEEIEQIKTDVATKNEVDIVKKLDITNKDGSVIIAEVYKTMYIANKSFYKEKRRRKK